MPIRRSVAATDVAAKEYQLCPAKTYTRPDGGVVPGRTVVEHCQIVGEVARALMARYPPRLAQALFPIGSALAAGSHDTGKVSPTFFNKLMKACQLPGIPDFPPEIEHQWRAMPLSIATLAPADPPLPPHQPLIPSSPLHPHSIPTSGIVPDTFSSACP